MSRGEESCVLSGAVLVAAAGFVAASAAGRGRWRGERRVRARAPRHARGGGGGAGPCHGPSTDAYSERCPAETPLHCVGALRRGLQGFRVSFLTHKCAILALLRHALQGHAGWPHTHTSLHACVCVPTTTCTCATFYSWALDHLYPFALAPMRARAPVRAGNHVRWQPCALAPPAARAAGWHGSVMRWHGGTHCARCSAEPLERALATATGRPAHCAGAAVPATRHAADMDFAQQQ
eukprot:359964-Chlamydomonas_euryale.AAC.2